MKKKREDSTAKGGGTTVSGKRAVMVKKFTISRRRWLRGPDTRNNGMNNSKLFRNSDKKMCCLGFYSRACGASIGDIRNEASVHGLRDRMPGQAKWLVLGTGPSIIARGLMRANDNPAMSEEDREATIVAAFATQGIDVEFTP